MQKKENGKARRLHIRKGDMVYVISGSYKHHRGRVLEVLCDVRRLFMYQIYSLSILMVERPRA